MGASPPSQGCSLTSWACPYWPLHLRPLHIPQSTQDVQVEIWKLTFKHITAVHQRHLFNCPLASSWVFVRVLFCFLWYWGFNPGTLYWATSSALWHFYFNFYFETESKLLNCPACAWASLFFWTRNWSHDLKLAGQAKLSPCPALHSQVSWKAGAVCQLCPEAHSGPSCFCKRYHTRTWLCSSSHTALP